MASVHDSKAKSVSPRTCCGVIEQARYDARAKQYARTAPQPWIVLKLMVGVTVGIMAYSAYVYIGRFCVGMIKHGRRGRSGSGSEGMGIGFLVVFCILLLWMVWAYAVVVFTPPGKATDHVPRTPEPSRFEPRPPRRFNSPSYNSHSLSGPSYENIIASHTTIGAGSESAVRNNTHNTPHTTNTNGNTITIAENGAPLNPDLEAGVVDSLALPHPLPNPPSRQHLSIPPLSHTPYSPSIPPGTHNRLATTSTIGFRNNRGPPQRMPHETPILLPEYRYCSRDGLVKPFRAHHCRNCGVCVLKYDHHCPWIGQCVGAQNQKFFLNFNQAASIFCLWTFSTLLGITVRSSNQDDFNVDPQVIVIIALSGFFALFTTLLTFSHIQLVLLNQSTVESMQIHSLKDRESAALRRFTGTCGFSARRRMRKQWDKEWGRIGLEGNIWWLGSYSKNWEDVMGDRKLGWILPIGRSKNDGLNYPVNPRFDQFGRWKPRCEWPAELQ